MTELEKQEETVISFSESLIGLMSCLETEEDTKELKSSLDALVQEDIREGILEGKGEDKGLEYVTLMKSLIDDLVTRFLQLKDEIREIDEKYIDLES